MKNHFLDLEKHLIITGHYGSGKTNIAINMAYTINYENKKNTDPKSVLLVDADIVNPYFRSADNKEELEKAGVRVIAPIYANTNLDIPALPAEINQVFVKNCVAVWDIGGDDAGATVLGRYSDELEKQGYSLYYVVNFYRPLTENSGSMTELLREIEKNSHLKAAMFINNSNLGSATTADDVRQTFERAKNFAVSSGLPLAYTSAIESLKDEFTKDELEKEKILFIKNETKIYW